MANKIYQPPNAPFDFFAQDGVQNAWVRRDTGGTTNGVTGLVSLITIPLVPNFFDSNAKAGHLNWYGNVTGVAGTKRLRVLFDATPIFDTGALAINNNNYIFYMSFWRRFDTFLQVRGDLFNNPFTGNLAGVTHSGKSDLLSNIDFSIAHSITLQGDVSAAADAVVIDGINGDCL